MTTFSEIDDYCSCGGSGTAEGRHLRITEDPAVESREDVAAEAHGEPLTALMLRSSNHSEHRILINGQGVTAEQARTYASELRRLADKATPAPGGLGIVDQIAATAGVDAEAMAEAVGLDVAAVRAQRAGGEVLSVYDMDRLALAVAESAAGAPSSD
jgi:hypothetical protein